MVKWLTLLTLVYIFLFHVVVIYFYTGGFLLTKSDVGRFSTLEDVHYTSHQVSFKKAVVVIVDALRYDFTVYNPDLPTSFYTNKLKVFNETLTKYPKNAFHFCFAADPPTTTMQRLLALTTGGMPTFIDAGSNFDSSAVAEDNWVHQLKASGKRVVFMGDDTWIGLYPNDFYKSYPYPSFNVKDLHTVDNGVIEHLIPEILSQDPWDVIIAHFLGVDHVGHRLGPDNIEMELKLLQMNDVIENLIEHIDEDTILFIMGDHGMTQEGNHGGATDIETDSALFVYSKRNISRLLPKSYESHIKLSQIDLVPTLSMLMKIPIPFGNLGTVVYELFLGADRRVLSLPDEDIERLDLDLDNLLDSLTINSEQVFRYLEAYASSSSSFPKHEILALRAKYDEAFTKLSTLESDRSTSKVLDAIRSFESFLKKSGEVCRTLWTTFDEKTMTICCLSCLSLTILYLLTLSLSHENVNTSALLRRVLYLSASLTCIYMWIVYKDYPKGIAAFVIAFVLYLVMLLSLNQYANWKALRNSNLQSIVIITTCILFISFRSVGLLSNSYTEAEKSVLNFMIQSSLILMILLLKKNRKCQGRLGIMSVCLKLLSLSLCGKHEIFFTESSILSTLLRSAVPLVLLFIVSNKKLAALGAHGLYNGSISLMFLNVALYWLALFNNSLDEFWVIRRAIPLFVYITTIVKLCIILSKKDSYDSKIWKLLITILPSTLLILGPGSPYTMLLFALILDSILEFCAIENLEMNSTNQQGIIVYRATFLALLSGFMFYVTGHTPEFSSLQFSAPFVGFDEMSYYAAGAIMVYNTLAPYIVIPLVIPLTLHNIPWKSRGTLLFKLLVMYSLVFHLVYLVAMFSTHIHRRHLMVWRVFAPKFVFDAFGLLTTDIALILTALIYYTSLKIKIKKK